MSSSNQITPLLSKEISDKEIQSQSHSYIDLINLGSLRKQFSRLIPEYMNYPKNKNYIPNRFYASNLEEIKKLQEEIISIKDAISSLKEKKQQKLEQIEQLRCFMRKVGSMPNNNHNNIIINKYQQRETNINKNTKQFFRGNNNNNNNRKRSNNSSENIEAGSFNPSTSDLSFGKDDDSAPQDNHDDYQDDLILSCDNSSSNNNNLRWHFSEGNDKKLQEKECCVVGKEE